MNITLTVVVSAIVILITALVIITIFGSTIGNVATVTEGKALCRSVFETSCKSSNAPPLIWNVNINGVVQACRSLEGLANCACKDYKVEGC